MCVITRDKLQANIRDGPRADAQVCKQIVAGELYDRKTNRMRLPSIIEVTDNEKNGFVEIVDGGWILRKEIISIDTSFNPDSEPPDHCFRCDGRIHNNDVCKKQLNVTQVVNYYNKRLSWEHKKLKSFMEPPQDRSFLKLGRKSHFVCDRCYAAGVRDKRKTNGSRFVPSGERFGGKSSHKKKSSKLIKTFTKVIAGKKRVIHTGKKGGKYHLTTRNKKKVKVYI